MAVYILSPSTAEAAWSAEIKLTRGDSGTPAVPTTGQILPRNS